MPIYVRNVDPQYMATKTGPYEVFVKDRGLMSTVQLPPFAAIALAEAIVKHANEAEALNNPPAEQFDNSGRGMDDPTGDETSVDNVLDPRD